VVALSSMRPQAPKPASRAGLGQVARERQTRRAATGHLATNRGAPHQRRRGHLLRTCMERWSPGDAVVGVAVRVARARFSWLNGLGLAHSHATLPVPEPERTVMLRRRVRFALARDGDVPRQRRYPLVCDFDLPAVGLRCALPQLRAARTRRVLEYSVVESRFRLDGSP
jgi:hypothetical protein